MFVKTEKQNIQSKNKLFFKEKHFFFILYHKIYIIIYQS